MSMVDIIKTADFKAEKHVPVIEAPEAVKSGEVFTAKISVGKEIGHPNTTEHFIGSITLFYKSDDGKFAFTVGRAEFSSHGESTEGANKGPVYTDPCASFAVKITQPGTLTAMSYCNIHGLWESSVKIKIS